ncbi:phosphohydrolase [Pseudomonas abietaniphila]|uniref:phosphohydrolase n=1 Tax=Pseudomonas abietaniphila TaxID=89065 RepID=UPI003216718A
MTGIHPTSTICIYHANCADGFGAAWVVRKALGSDVEFHAASYGEPAPDVTGKDVVVVDFSYPLQTLVMMSQVAESVLVLDHHKSAQTQLDTVPAAGINHLDAPQDIGRLHALFDMNRSGAGIAWDYFFPDAPRPALINHIEDRDLWRFSIPGTKAITAAIFSYPHDFEVWDYLAETDLRELALEGSAIDRKHQKDVKHLVETTRREMLIGGHTVPVANLPPTMASDAGSLLAKGSPFAACYWDTSDARQFSLRSTDEGEDVSQVATQYGGGGHRNAAGFKVALDHPLALSTNLAWLIPGGPPFPPGGQGLPRYGLRWNGPTLPLSVPMDDGYWTPWHLADRLNSELAELKRADECWSAVVSYMLGDGRTQEPLEFLRCWNDGNFQAIRDEWPDAPKEVFYADPLFKGEAS